MNSPVVATDPSTLSELRNARLSYSYLRRKGDPTQFWETLLLARQQRALVAPGEGIPFSITPEAEASLVKELEAVRAESASLVRNLRGLLQGVPDLPEPSDRFEMALAFLLASTRDRQAAARWLDDPALHREAASKKLRSLAAISDPYREALLPWTLDVPGGGSEDAARPETPPVASRGSSVDPRHLESLQLAVRCRATLVGLGLEAELWETLLLATTEPAGTRTALEATVSAIASGRPEESKPAVETLRGRVKELRRVYAEWVRLLYAHTVEKQPAPDDRRTFEVGLGLMLADPRARERLGYWIEDPAAWQDEAAGLLAPCARLARDYLAEVDAPKP